jgi:RAB protein geranylgeranyltransferase component A
MKSEFGISSSFVGSRYGTAELCVGFCKALGLGSTISGSISDSVTA